MPRNIYSVELKLEVIDYVEHGHSADAAAEKYSIHVSHIRRWLAIYKEHGLEGIDRKTRSFTPEFKQQVLEDIRANGLSYREAAVKYNIGHHSSVQKWERLYLEHGAAGLQIDNRGKACKEVNALKGKRKKQSAPDKDLIDEIQRLRMENDYLKKLSALAHSKDS